MKLGIGRVMVLAIGVSSVGATCQQVKQDTKWVLDQTQSACVIANLLLPTATVATICKIDATLVPWLDVVLSAHRTIAAKVRGESTCAPAPVTSTSASTK